MVLNYFWAHKFNQHEEEVSTGRLYATYWYDVLSIQNTSSSFYHRVEIFVRFKRNFRVGVSNGDATTNNKRVHL